MTQILIFIENLKTGKNSMARYLQQQRRDKTQRTIRTLSRRERNRGRECNERRNNHGRKNSPGSCSRSFQPHLHPAVHNQQSYDDNRQFERKVRYVPGEPLEPFIHRVSFWLVRKYFRQFRSTEHEMSTRRVAKFARPIQSRQRSFSDNNE